MVIENKLSLRRIFFSFSAILAFIVDLVAFLHIFGLDIILRPNKSTIAFPNRQPIMIGAVTMEAVTFVLWLYLAIVTVLLYFFLVNSSSILGGLLGLLLSVLTPLLLLIWLWVFGHIAQGLYVFLFPTTIFTAIAWYSTVAQANKTACRAGCLLMFIGLGFGILWFRSVSDWSIFKVITAGFASWLVGWAVGSSYGLVMSKL